MLHTAIMEGTLDKVTLFSYSNIMYACGAPAGAVKINIKDKDGDYCRTGPTHVFNGGDSVIWDRTKLGTCSGLKIDVETPSLDIWIYSSDNFCATTVKLEFSNQNQSW